MAVFLDSSMQAQLSTSKVAGARQLALSGISFASTAPAANLPFTATRTVQGEGKFTVIRSSDSGRININALLKKRDLVAISRILSAWGSEYDKVGNASTALEHRTWLLSGNDNSGAGFIPFESFAQLQSIPEFAEAVKKKENWRDLITFWGSGAVDVNYAKADVLMALGGLNASQANTIIETRAGKDGQEGTKDDVHFSSLENVILTLGLSETSARQLRTYFGTKTEIERITSIGDIRGMQRKVQVILKSAKEDGTPLAWDEE